MADDRHGVSGAGGTDEHGQWSLVMPFVVCKGSGGPYEDHAFVAGYTAASLESKLINAHPSCAQVQHYVHPPLVPQLDLIAMRHGWVLESEPWDEYPDDWALVTFTRVGDDDVS